MASLEHTIQVIFGASTNSSFNSTLSGVSGRLGALDVAVQSVAAPVADLTTKLLSAEAALAALAAAMIGSAVKAAGDYSQASVQLGTNFNATKEQSKALGDELLAFGKTAAFSYKDIQDAAGIALSTGTDAKDITALLAENQKLAAVGGESLATATSVIARSLNAYGESADKAKPYADALFLAAQQGDTNFAQLATQLGAVTSTASASKVPFDDLMSAVSAVTIAGVSTSETMTKLKSLFLELSVPSDDLKKALGGVTLEGDGLQAVMAKIKEVTGGTTDKMSGLFSSTEALSAATILANDSAGVFATTLGLMADKTGIVEKNYNNLTASFDVTNTKMANNLQAALVEIGTPLLDEYGTIGKAIASLFDTIGLSATSGGLKPILDMVEKLAGEVGTTLQGVADALPDALNLLNFDDLIASFKGLGGEFEKAFDEIFGGGLDLTKPEDLAVALQKGVNIMTTLVDVTSGIIDSFKPVFELLNSAANEASNVGDGTAETIGKVMGSLTLIADMGTALGGFLVALNAGGADIKATFGFILGAVEIFANGIHSSFLLIQAGFASFIQDFFEAKSIITFGDTSEQAKKDAEIWGETLNGINAEIAQNGEDISKAWSKMFGDTGADKAATQVKEAAGKIADSTKDMTANANEGMTKVGDTLKFSADKFDEWAAKVDAFSAAGIDVTSEWTEAGGVINFVAEKTDELTKSTDESTDAAGKQVDAAQKSADALEKTKKSTDDLSESQELAIKQTHELELKLIDVASNEKIKFMEFSASIKTAQIEADAKVLEAAFNSVADIVSSTSGAVSEMFGLLGNQNLDFPEYIATLDAAKDANERANKALENATKLNDAQVKYLETKTDKLANSDGLITIKGDNLAPELQAVLQGIIEHAQIAANAEALEILLP